MAKKKESNLWIIIVVVIIVVLLLGAVYVANINFTNKSTKKSGSSEKIYERSTPKVAKPTVQLTDELVAEICREIEIYTDYCYRSGIGPIECGNQMAEKVSRLWELTSSQAKEVWGECSRRLVK